MTNPYYTATGTPGTGSAGASAPQRNEFLLLQAAFDKLPAILTANALVVVNSGGTGLTVTPAAFSLAGGFTTTGAFSTTLAQQATVTLTLPAVNGTLATLAGTETLTNKTMTAPVLTAPVIATITNTGTLTLPTATDTLVGRQTTDTLTNKSISGATNTLTAIPNAALTNSTITIGGSATALGGSVLGNVENKSSATIRNELTLANVKTALSGLTPARVNTGTATNSGNISWGTGAPGTLDEGQIYFRYP